MTKSYPMLCYSFLDTVVDKCVLTACVDVLGWNQCAVNNGGCSHLCIANTGGRGHHCACPTHYELSPDNVTCTGMCVGVLVISSWCVCLTREHQPCLWSLHCTAKYVSRCVCIVILLYASSMSCHLCV